MANSMFTKRHYEAVSAVLRETRGYLQADPGTLDLVRFLMSNLFEADNPQDGKGHGFKREKFEEECKR